MSLLFFILVRFLIRSLFRRCVDLMLLSKASCESCKNAVSSQLLLVGAQLGALDSQHVEMLRSLPHDLLVPSTAIEASTLTASRLVLPDNKGKALSRSQSAPESAFTQGSPTGFADGTGFFLTIHYFHSRPPSPRLSSSLTFLAVRCFDVAIILPHLSAACMCRPLC